MSIFDRTNLSLSRRQLLIGASLTGAGLVIGFRPQAAVAAGEPFSPNAFIRIPQEGKVTFVMPSVEMGQGIYTAVAMMLAEELEVGLDQVVLEHAPADPKQYANPLLGDQITGGSFAIRGVYEQMRKAGAAARIMLIGAAARDWGVSPDACKAEAGHVVETAASRRAAYGSLIAAAASEVVPQEVPLKPASSYRVIGKPVQRLDSPEKVNGTAQFGMDVHFPGIKKRLLQAALEVFFEVREMPGLKKKPSTSELLDWLKLLLAEDIPPEALRAPGHQASIPPLYGALLKNEQDVHLFEQLLFMQRRGR